MKYSKKVTKRIVEIDVRRNNGIIETVVPDNIISMNDAQYAKIKEATYNAGRGTCIGYRNVDREEDVEISAAERRVAILDRLDYLAQKSHNNCVKTAEMTKEENELKAELASIKIDKKEVKLTESQIWG